MNWTEALAAVEAGSRITSDALSLGWVIKLYDVDPNCEGHSVVEHPSDENEGMACELCPARLMVVNEATGSSFACLYKPSYQHAGWRIIEGWASYA